MTLRFIATFKQGQQTMADIVLKYYADNIQAQQSQNNNRGLGR